VSRQVRIGAGDGETGDGLGDGELDAATLGDGVGEAPGPDRVSF
jgi:hypothetical protein